MVACFDTGLLKSSYSWGSGHSAIATRCSEVRIADACIEREFGRNMFPVPPMGQSDKERLRREETQS